MEPEGDTLSTVSVDSSYSSTLRSHTSGTRTRTKRRAPPPPPVAVKPANRIVSTPEEPAAEDAQNEDLRNLTAEIESFVRISSVNGDATVKNNTSTVQSDVNVEPRVHQPHDVNNNSAQPEIPTTISTIENEIVGANSNVEIVAEETAEIKKIINTEKETIQKEINEVPVDDMKPTVVQSGTAITVNTVVSVPAETSPTPSPRKRVEKTQPEVRQDEPPEVTPSRADIDFEHLALPATPVPIRRTNRETREKYITQNVATVSKLTSEKSTVTKQNPPTTEQVDDEGPTTTIIVDNLHYKHKVAPIHTEISSKIETARMKISESTGNIPTMANENASNERRRSVKDIIESINKSQSMLKVNHEQSSSSTNGLHETQSTDSMLRNIRELNEREKEIQNLLQDIDARYGTSSAQADDTSA
uniref:Uncharacterized protein n=1 Tax=Anopheles maculatus TaxID=74869 RepID=A0A182SI80_9DIPT